MVYRKRYSRHNCRVIANLPLAIAMLPQLIVNLTLPPKEIPQGSDGISNNSNAITIVRIAMLPQAIRLLS